MGVQLCQSVIRYYTQFRSFDEEINFIVTRAKVFECTLEALDCVRAQVEVRGGHASRQLQGAIEACTSGLSNLNVTLRKCGKTKLPVSQDDKPRLLKKRLLWPFKQSTLSHLRTALDELQANVQLGVQVLEL
jgi:hypothetical protein